MENTEKFVVWVKGIISVPKFGKLQGMDLRMRVIELVRHNWKYGFITATGNSSDFDEPTAIDEICSYIENNR